LEFGGAFAAYLNQTISSFSTIEKSSNIVAGGAPLKKDSLRDWLFLIGVERLECSLERGGDLSVAFSALWRKCP